MTDQSTSTSCVWVGTNLMQAPLDKLDPQQDHALERGKTWTQRSSMQSSTYTLQQQDILWPFQPCLEGKNIQGISETSSTGIAVKTTFWKIDGYFAQEKLKRILE